MRHVFFDRRVGNAVVNDWSIGQRQGSKHRRRQDGWVDGLALNSGTDGGTLHLQPNLKVKACSKETPPCRLVNWRAGSGWRRPKSASWRTKAWCGRSAGRGRATANMTKVRLTR